MNANLFESLRRFADEAPDRTALIHRGAMLNYGDFRVRVERRAAELRRRGVGKGEKAFEEFKAQLNAEESKEIDQLVSYTYSNK